MKHLKAPYDTAANRNRLRSMDKACEKLTADGYEPSEESNIPFEQRAERQAYRTNIKREMGDDLTEEELT